jgi:hypothetical protein
MLVSLHSFGGLPTCPTTQPSRNHGRLLTRAVLELGVTKEPRPSKISNSCSTKHSGHNRGTTTVRTDMKSPVSSDQFASFST